MTDKDENPLEELLDEMAEAVNAPEETEEPGGEDLDPLAIELQAVTDERDELKDKLLRTYAELENYRKRADRDRKDAEIYGGTKLARDLLGVYDNMSRAIESVDDELRETATSLIEGLDLTKKELISTFSKHNIVVISPELGDKFDPQIHQAMFEAPLPDTKAGEIIQVMAEGFMIAERLLRPAQVGVSSGS